MKAILLALTLLVGTLSGASALAQQTATAILAGGCFWCVESDFEKLPGVRNAESGYIGGHVPNPTYKQVSAGTSGHVEAVRITYDPAKISYAQLLDHFWRNIDPTDPTGQFCDVGPQYRSVIFYLDAAQKAAAETSKSAIERSGVLRHVRPLVRVASSAYPPEFLLEAQAHAEADAKAEAKGRVAGKVYTELLPATTFYPAEDYHQDYAKKNPRRYAYYRTGCGRDARLQHIWGR